jgi:tartrate-resistant acid phosphatase type 5
LFFGISFEILISIVVVFVAVIAAVLWIVYRYFPSPHVAKTVNMRSHQSREVSLLMVGDVGSGRPAQFQVAELMNTIAATRSIDALVFAGDNFINHGVTDIHDPLWKERFHDVYALEHIRKLPVFAVLGNHDYAGNPQAQIDYSKVHVGRWNMPARHYAVNIENIVEIGCIDTNFPDRSGIGLLPLDKVERELRDSTAAWKIVVGHRPLYSSGLYTSIQLHLRFILERFLARAGACVYLSGHDHCQQHIPFRPLLSKSREVHQVVAGCGGSDLRDVNLNHRKSLYNANEHGAVLVTATPEKLEVSFFVIGKPEPAHVFVLKK